MKQLDMELGVMRQDVLQEKKIYFTSHHITATHCSKHDIDIIRGQPNQRDQTFHTPTSFERRPHACEANALTTDLSPHPNSFMENSCPLPPTPTASWKIAVHKPKLRNIGRRVW